MTAFTLPCSGVVNTWLLMSHRHKDGDKVMALKIGDGRSIEDQVGVLKL